METGFKVRDRILCSYINTGVHRVRVPTHIIRQFRVLRMIGR